MIELKDTVETIVRSLPQWEADNLNEAQTCQAIILRILFVAGYDIWDPLTVFPQKNSGGGAGGYVPDFTILLSEKPRFIIEVKALSKTLTDNDRIQAVNYVNSIGLRWAILTNGRTWLFLDNQQSGAAYEKLALSITIDQEEHFLQLTDLLNPSIWQAIDANTQIATLIQLIHLKAHILKIHAKGYASNEKGLNLLIKQELNLEKTKLATQHFEQLKIWFLNATNALVPEIPLLTDNTISPEILPPTDLILQLAENIKKLCTDRRLHNPSVIALGTVTIETTWRNIYVGTVEMCLALDKEVKQTLEPSHLSYKKHPDWYHVLSNGKILLVSLNSEEIRKRLIELLKILSIPTGSVKIFYKQQTYLLP